MRFAPSRHMAFAKERQLVRPVKLDLTVSAASPATLEDLGGVPEGLRVNGRNAYGHPEALRTLASWYGVPESRIFPTAGSSLANFLVMTALLEPGDRVVLEQPTYEPLLRLAQMHRARIVRVRRREEDAWALDPDAFRKALGRRARLAVLTNLNNPTSAATPPALLRELARLAERAGAHLLVDEVYLDGGFDVRPRLRPAAALAPNAISTSSWTKAYGLGGLRSGWVVGPAALLARLRQLRNLVDVHNPFVSDQFTIQAFRRRKALLARAERCHRENWPVMASWLDRNPEWSCVRPRGGFVCFPRLPRGVDPGRFHEILYRKFRCAVTPGEFFGEPRHVRIGFGTDRRTLEAGLEAVSRAAALA